MTEGLRYKRCAPREGSEPLRGKTAEKLLSQIFGWKIVDEKYLVKDFSFPNFKEALSFVNNIGEMAENENHHPEITFTWGKATVRLSTHAVGGLSENDFILAAKIDALP